MTNKSSIKFSEFSSVTLNCDKNNISNHFSINCKLAKKRRRNKREDGSVYFTTVNDYPTLGIKLQKFDSGYFDADAIRSDVYACYGRNAAKKQVNKRVSAIKELATHDVDFYLSGTRENYNVDVVVMSVDGQQIIKGIAYCMDEDSVATNKQLKKIYFTFEEMNDTAITTNSDISTPYDRVYKTFSFVTVKKKIVSTDIFVKDNTVNTHIIFERQKDVKKFVNAQSRDTLELLKTAVQVKVNKKLETENKFLRRTIADLNTRLVEAECKARSANIDMSALDI